MSNTEVRSLLLGSTNEMVEFGRGTMITRKDYDMEHLIFFIKNCESLALI